jgi:1-acyl-sn-glycerol-3-phosphate acyltransferase
MKFLSKLLLKLLGWKIIIDIPLDLKKYVVAVAPHTSWKDFPIGLFIRSAIDRNIYYLGKKELFDGPLGFFFWWTGGRPVDRKQKTGLVDEVGKLFAGSEEFAIAIAPEGTRKQVHDLKTGFYFIARKAGVPIIPCLLDYEHKTCHFLKPFYPTSETEKDLDALWNIFKGVKGANPTYSIMGDRIPHKSG